MYSWPQNYSQHYMYFRGVVKLYSIYGIILLKSMTKIGISQKINCCYIKLR